VEVVVERCKNIVDVFWTPQEAEPVDSPQFINHPLRKKISLKTLAKVLSTGLFSDLTNKRPLFEGKKASIGKRVHAAD
jgi:hypothetical protein